MTSSPTKMMEKFSGQCRFCLEDETQEALIRPCQCEGTAACVHPVCLERWQQRHPDRNFCEVCRQPWSLPLAPTRRLCFVKNMSTNPRYTRISSTTIDAYNRAANTAALPHPYCDYNSLREALLARMRRPGTLIVQTPRQASECARDVRFPANLSSLAAVATAFLAVRITSHWVRGAFLILYVGPGQGADGSDMIIAVNLTRLDELEEEERHLAVEQLHQADLPPEHQQQQEGEGEGEEDEEVVVQLRKIRGGPCAPKKPLYLFSHHNPTTSSDGSSDVAGQGDDVPIGDNVGDLLCVDIPLACSSTCPDDSNTPPHAAPTGSEAHQHPQSLHRSQPMQSFVCCEGDVASRVLLQAHKAEKTRGEKKMTDDSEETSSAEKSGEKSSKIRSRVKHGALEIVGVAVWSTEQLLSEIIRGSWGLCDSCVSDLPLPVLDVASSPSPSSFSSSAPPHAGGSDAATSGRAMRGFGRRLWQECWDERNPLCRPGTEKPCDDEEDPKEGGGT